MNKMQLQIDAKAAADLIRDPSHWTRGRHAETADGESRGPRNTDAVRWCAEGACERATRGSFEDQEPDGALRAGRLMDALRQYFGDTAPFHINDGPNGHARILAALDAIAGGES